jgi:hypothetical protein
MNKPIRITEENATAIESALHAVNGTARQHSFTDYAEIAAVAESAEKEVAALVGKTHAAGAMWAETSGQAVCNAYAKQSRTRVATTVRLERRPSGWFLADVKKTKIWQQGGGSGLLTLTQAQADRATEIFRRRFSVAPAAVAVAA